MWWPGRRGLLRPLGRWEKAWMGGEPQAAKVGKRHPHLPLGNGHCTGIGQGHYHHHLVRWAYGLVQARAITIIIMGNGHPCRYRLGTIASSSQWEMAICTGKVHWAMGNGQIASAPVWARAITIIITMAKMQWYKARGTSSSLHADEL